MFQLLGFEVFQVRLQKKPLQLSLSIEMHKVAIFDRLKIKCVKNLGLYITHLL
jgi:predicted transport protein